MSVINTNITSMISQGNLNKSKGALTTAMERLSSGMRINSAKDDAAGQAIANRMTSQVKGLAQAQRNANDGISVAQTAEGALNQINDNLQRIRELSVQAANGTNNDDDLTSIQNEIGQRLNEINRISEETSFNGVKVLASDQGLKIQVGANDNETITVNLQEINSRTLGLTGFNVDGSGNVDNDAATADDLVLAGFTKALTPSANGSYAYSKTETVTNAAANVANVLSKADTGDTIAYTGTANGTNTAAAGNYTYNASTNSFSFAANDVSSTNTISYLTQGMVTGDMKSATVNIGGTTQDIKFDKDGKIFAADDNVVLHLDSTGNLTKNSAGSPPAATLENLAASMTVGAGTSTNTLAPSNYTQGVAGTTTESAQFTFSALAEGESVTIAGRTLTANGAMTDTEVATAFADQFGTANGISFGTAGAAGSFTMTGTAANWTAGTSAGNQLTFTSTTATTDVADITATTTTLGAPTGGSISLGGTVLTADAANGFDIAGAQISAASLTSQLQSAGGSMTISYGAAPDVTYDIAAGGAVSVATAAQYVQVDGSLGAADESDTTTTYYAHSNGNVTDDSGKQVFKRENGEFTFDVTTAGTRTADPLRALDEALNKVDSLRSDLGAIQNRFDSAITNLSTNSTNLMAARSRIEDADYAVEVANMTRAQILQQAGTSVLAQANQVPQGVLSLLR